MRVLWCRPEILSATSSSAPPAVTRNPGCRRRRHTRSAASRWSRSGGGGGVPCEPSLVASGRAQRGRAQRERTCARRVSDSSRMDLRDSPGAGGSVRRAQGEVSSMAVPALVVAVVLILVFVPVWALIWGRKETPATVRVSDDTGPARLRARDRSEP